MKTCPKCGYKNDNDSKFCINCGADIALTLTSEQLQAEEQLRRQQADAEKAERQRQADAEKAAREQEKQRAKEQKDAERAAIKAQKDAERAAAKAQKEADRAAKKAAAGAGKAAGSKSGSAGSKTGTATSTTGKRLSPALIAVIAVVAIAAILTGIHFSPLGPIFTKQKLEALSFDFAESAVECGTGPVETTVYASFDISADTSGLKLLAVCKETGEKIELTDDGLGVDTIAGDNVFRGSVTLGSQEEKTLKYTLTLGEGSKKYSLSAPEATVKYFTVESYNAEEEQIDRIAAELDALTVVPAVDYDQSPEKKLTDFNDNKAKAEELLKQKQASGEIVSYEWAGTFFIIKMPLGVYGYDVGYPYDDILSGGSAYESLGSSGEWDPYFNQGAEVIYLCPYNDKNADKPLPSDAIIQAGRTLESSNLGYSIKVASDGDVDKELLMSLGQYRIVVIYSHGSMHDVHGLLIGTGMVGKDISVKDCINESFVTLRGRNSRSYVTKKFFERYYEDGSLNGCLIYMCSCQGFNSSDMANTFIQKGASAVVGYKNIVRTDYNDRVFTTMFEELIKEDGSGTGITKTVSDAFKETIRVNGAEASNEGPDGKHARPTLLTAKDKPEFRLVDEDDPKNGKLTLVVSGANEGMEVKNVTVAIDGFGGRFRTIEMGDINAGSWYIPEGDYDVTISAPGYLPQTHSIRITFRQENIVSAALEPDPAVIAAAVDDLLNGVFWPSYDDKAMIDEHKCSGHVSGLIAISRMYRLLNAQDPARYPRTWLENLNDQSSYSLSADDEARMRAGGQAPGDFSERYYLSDVQAVLDRIYGKDRVTPEEFFGEACFVTSDGYMLYWASATDYTIDGWNRYFIRDIQQTADGLDVTVSCVYLDYCYAYDDFGIFATPMTGTYMLYDIVAGKRLAEDSDDSLKTESDYPAFLKNLNVESIGAATTVLHMFIDSDGAHLK